MTMILAILHLLGGTIEDLVRHLPPLESSHEFKRQVYAEDSGDELIIHFAYADYDAIYELPNATPQEFDEVLRTLRDGLSRLIEPNDRLGGTIKTDAVVSSFLRAMQLWPHANPSGE